MNVKMIAFRHGSNSQPAFVVFLDGDLARDQYLEARADFELPGFLISAEIDLDLPSGAVDLAAPYTA